MSTKRAPIDPKHTAIEVVRVSNGWIVRPASIPTILGQMRADPVAVAETPERLLAVIEQWATGDGA